MERAHQSVNLLLFTFKIEAEPAGRVPPDAILFVQAQRQAFFCFVFFVATKKMTLLSGKPDGFAFDSEVKSSTKRATD
jgi:hypothetical protein